ncbi:hypothetical protein BD324DRAFT_614782 [Kockovaella imperatae]|uniref:CUE domain-containing protein n=1 Tax=Kockovaella imperatae TaxID=4999 RepID=A0A1Y1UQG1_9TREE|nr:hypothetical protein BD324DRAFT_614782 [Kockovaella imperatae]ORX39734.1 hypothetical protein BD324DRAFT_614782 [Kockovaella imperatae]
MSGFQNASVTKGMMMLLGISSLTVSLLDVKPYLHLQLVPHMTKYHQFWRIVIHPLAFTNSSELLMGLVLLYTVGIPIERSFGPRKYASFVLVSSLVSTVFSLMALVFLHKFGLRYIPAGPYGVLFSLLWQHYRIIPTLYTYRILGIELSDKAIAWMQACILYLSDIPASVLAASSGLLTGYLYRTDTLIPLPSFRYRRLLRPLKTYRIPLSLYSLLSRLFTPLIGESTAPRRANRVLPGQINSTSSALRPGTAPSLSSLLAGRLGGANLTRRPTATTPVQTEDRPVTPPVGTPINTATPSRAAAIRQTLLDRAAATSGNGPGAGSARGAVGEWVSDLTGRGSARAPTEEEIGALSNMFPNLSREVIVRALQRNDHNTAQAVEALLQEGS